MVGAGSNCTFTQSQTLCHKKAAYVEYGSGPAIKIMTPAYYLVHDFKL